MRFPGFNTLWKECEIGNILKIGSGKDYKHLSKGNIPVFGTGGYMTSVNNYLFDGETVCIGRKGTINKPLYFNGRLWTVDTLFYTHSFRNVIPKFVFYAFEQVNWLKYNEASGVPSLSKRTIEQIKVTIPEVSEQKRIATLLSLIDDRIQTQNKIIDNLETLIKGLSLQLFQHRLKFKNNNNRNNFTDWKLVKLEEIATITTGSSNREDSILDGEYTFFDRSQDIRTSHRYLFDKEAIIVPGEGQEFIPKYFIGKFDLHQRTYAIFDFKGVDGKYLYYHITQKDKHLLSQAVGSTVKSLRLPIFKNMPINLPQIEEQTKIASFLSLLDEKLQVEKTLLRRLTEQKQYLLQQLFI